MRESAKGLILIGADEDSNEATVEINGDKQPALKKEQAKQTIITQLSKLRNTIFECSEVRVETLDVYFLPVSRLNAAKRELAEKMLEAREVNRRKTRTRGRRERPSQTRPKNLVRDCKNFHSYLGQILPRGEAWRPRANLEGCLWSNAMPRRKGGSNKGQIFAITH